MRWFFDRYSLIMKNEQENCFEVLSGRKRGEVVVRPELMENVGAWHELSKWTARKNDS